MTTATKPKETFIKFIAYLQVIGIILVVFGHSFHEYPDDSNGTSLLIYRLCYNFRMPLFMFVSGFLMMHTEFMKGKAPSLRRFGWGKIKRLLIPYFTLSLLTYFPRAALSGMADEEVELSGVGLIKSLFVTDMLPIPYFWFIQASFLLLIASYAVVRVCRRFRLPDTLAIAFLIIGSVVLQTLDLEGREIFGYMKAIYFSTFFIAGMVYCRYFQAISKHLPLDSTISFCVAFAVWIVSFLHWEGTPYVRISSIFGIAMCISLAKLMVKHHVTLLDHLIGANYMIFLLSWYFNVATQQILSHYVSLPWQVHTLLSLTFGIYVPWLGYRWLRSRQHSRWARHIAFLLGQSFKRRPLESK